MSAKKPKVNLHKKLKERSYDHALISTFTFSIRFFEEYVLERLKGVYSAGNLTVLLDRGEYEEIVSVAGANGEWAPKQANRRYLLQPIDVPGVFHPKVFLFANKTRGLLVIGSANFSQDGLGSNAELVSVFEFEREKNEACLPLFQEALEFFEGLVERWPGKEAEMSLSELRGEVPWLTEELPEDGRQGLPVLLSNFDRPLWEQIRERLPKKVESVSLVSRFFDASPTILDSTVLDLDPERVAVYTQPTINTLTPSWLEHPAHEDGRLSIRLCSYQDQDHHQQLHGKAYAFEADTGITLACGSANFSTAALLRTAQSGNAEILLLYPEVPAAQFDPTEFFDPGHTARMLTDPDELKPNEEEPTEPVSRAQRYTLLLEEGWIEDDKLFLNSEVDLEGLDCRVSQANVRDEFLKVGGGRENRFTIELSPDQKTKLMKVPSVVQVGLRDGKEWLPESNPVLVAALQDLDTGRNLRQERRIREAKESPERFMGVLKELCEGDDDTRLRLFLTHCDIPFSLAFRMLRKRRKPTGGDRDFPTGFRDFGQRNLRHFELLHDAVVDFAARHERRLWKHAETGTAEGIPNYLHILETVLQLLLSQIERVAVGLEAESETRMTADQWHVIRSNLADYYGLLESLLSLTANEYVQGLLESEDEREVADGFGDSASEILGIYDRAIELRDEIVQLAQDRVRIPTPSGSFTGGRFFRTRIAEEKWPGYRKGIQETGKRLKKLSAA